ncbi:flagellar basal body-associated protein FliL [Kurthia massiliensis]|uniref:flagellar basal body-associated protein FliL n=1 Tax=Kurthia massiliensis TaxID=1033739 RepID=UPI000287B589|nr:flagellar basal body-associated protein FliL [Kurthia massiliensis]
MKNKILTITLVILVSITLIGVVAFVVITQIGGKDDTANAEPDIDTVLKSSVDVEELTTNLKGSGFVKISLKVQTDSKDAAEELLKRDFQMKDILIEELSELTAQDLEGKKGKEVLQSTLKTKFNELMQEGQIQRVYITSCIIQ